MGRVAIAGLLIFVLIVGTGSALTRTQPATSRATASEHQIQGMEHSCCPGLRGKAGLMLSVPPSAPCGNGHLCCMSSNPPAKITSTMQSGDSGIQQSVRAVMSPSYPKCKSAMRAGTHATPVIRNMVLRI